MAIKINLTAKVQKVKENLKLNPANPRDKSRWTDFYVRDNRSRIAPLMLIGGNRPTHLKNIENSSSTRARSGVNLITMNGLKQPTHCWIVASKGNSS